VTIEQATEKLKAVVTEFFAEMEKRMHQGEDFQLALMTVCRTRPDLIDQENSLRDYIKHLGRKHSGGYSISALSKLFGTHRRLVESWATLGLLGKPHVQGRHGGDIRFTEAAVARFTRRHPQEYDLARVDREWFKGIVFGVTETSV
jgi:hypothetical protein